jgi:hypothetical protein
MHDPSIAAVMVFMFAAAAGVFFAHGGPSDPDGGDISARYRQLNGKFMECTRRPSPLVMVRVFAAARAQSSGWRIR